MDYRNKNVEGFLLDFLPKHEDVSLSQCSMYLSNYYLEAEGKAFDNENYINQDDRIEAMFPGMPERPLNLIKFKAYKHRATDHKETGNEDRIKELETAVSTTVYNEFTPAIWWVP